MRIICFISVLLCMFLIFGCSKYIEGNNLYKGIPSAEISSACLGYKDDVCSLFECMVNQCWCASGIVPSPVLSEGKAIIQNEDEAMNTVRIYLQNKESAQEVKRAVKLNSVFYNVFAEDKDYNEEVFTVAVDGTIIKTQCWV